MQGAQDFEARGGIFMRRSTSKSCGTQQMELCRMPEGGFL